VEKRGTGLANHCSSCPRTTPCFRRTGTPALALPTSRYAKYPGARPQTYLSSHRYSVRAKQFP
jgi:hypothetical protein